MIYSVGDAVMSIAGRDSGKLFAIVGIIDENYLYIADGKSRKAGSPKKKKTKHIKLVKKAEGDFYPIDAALRKTLSEILLKNKKEEELFCQKTMS